MLFPNKILPLSIALVTLLARPATAEMAEGTYEFEFESDLPLWDISGTYFEQVDDLALEYTIVMDPDGRFTATGLAEYTGFVGEDAVDLIGPISFSGKLLRAGNVTRINVRFRFEGGDDVFGSGATFRGALRQKLEMDPDFLEFFGPVMANLRVSLPGQPSQRVRSKTGVSFSLPEDMDGTWLLTLNVFSSDNNYYGTAWIQLSTGNLIFFDLAGLYSPEADLSSLQLQGQDIFSGSNLRLTATVAGGEMTLQSFNGLVLGQRLRFKNVE